MVAYTPEQEIRLKMFHCEIQNEYGEIGREKVDYLDFPVVKEVGEEMVEENYKQVTWDIFAVESGVGKVAGEVGEARFK